MNFDSYTQKSLEAVQSARQLAVTNGHQQLEQVHLLLALLQQDGGLIPQLFNVGSSVRALAAKMLVIDGLVLPIESLVHVTYFTIRSGGKTLITFLFDSVYSWLVPVPLAFCLCRFTSLDIITTFAIVQFSAVIKMVIGLFMLRSDFWAKKIV